MVSVIQALKENSNTAGRDAILWRGAAYSYSSLFERIEHCQHMLDDKRIPHGAVVALKGDFTPETIALFLAMIEHNCIIVPLLTTNSDERDLSFAQIAGVEHLFRVSSLGVASPSQYDSEGVEYEGLKSSEPHQHIRELRGRNVPGLILFSSGSSGRPKAAVHDFSKLLKKFETRRAPLKILNFLLFDHWGGLNTMLHTLYSGGTVLTVQSRSPDEIAAAIASYQVQVLPASPSFLNLMLISQVQNRHDLSSLEIISYGTEPMPDSTLKRLSAAFPSVKLQQTYGLIELGVLRSKSKSSDSLWVKIGGEGYQTRVVDGLLEIKADSAMLGYLNAPDPFTADGWFMTGDAVEIDGDYFKILGRKSELINVGGEKVYPQEIENVIANFANVSEVVVYGEKNSIMGNIVCATVRLTQAEDPKSAVSRLRSECKQVLASFKVPVKIVIADASQHNERFKKIRMRES